MKFSKAIVSLVIALNVFFTIAVLFIFYRVGVEPTTLIAAWFSFTTVELWALASIKKREIEQNDNVYENRYDLDGDAIARVRYNQDREGIQ
jgi:hypothetical protein